LAGEGDYWPVSRWNRFTFSEQLIVIAEQGVRVSRIVHPDPLEKRNTLCSV